MLKKLIVLTAAAICAATAFAEGFVPSFNVGATYHAKNVSKGYVMMDGAFIEYNVGAAVAGFSFNTTFKQDLTAFDNIGHNNNYTRNRRYRIKEIDYVLAYKKSFDFGLCSPISLGASYEYDQYPAARNWGRTHSKPHDRVWTLTAGLDNVLAKDGNASLGFVANFIYDADANSGENNEWCWRGDVTAAFGYKLNDKVTLGVALTAYWRDSASNELVNYSYKGVTSGYTRINGFSANAMTLKPSISYAITENLSVSAYASASTALNEKARKQQENAYMNSTINYDAGFGIAYKF